MKMLDPKALLEMDAQAILQPPAAEAEGAVRTHLRSADDGLEREGPSKRGIVG